MKTLLSLCLVTLFNLVFSQNSEPLPDGDYEVVYDANFENHTKFEFTIKDDLFISKSEIETSPRKNEHNGCILSLEKVLIPENKEQSLFKKVLNKENPFYQIEKISNCEFKFIFGPDFHIRNSSGKFIRKNCYTPSSEFKLPLEFIDLIF